jgi:uncharacterized protein YjbJ (UPF0337 family)
MDQEIAKGKWTEFKGEMRKLWGNLTENELEQTKGNIKQIGGLLQQKYGQMKDSAKTEFDTLIQRFAHDANVQSEKVKDSVKGQVDDTH